MTAGDWLGVVVDGSMRWARDVVRRWAGRLGQQLSDERKAEVYQDLAAAYGVLAGEGEGQDIQRWALLSDLQEQADQLANAYRRAAGRRR